MPLSTPETSDKVVPLKLLPVTSIVEIDAKVWNDLNKACGDNPFTDHRFLSALERTQSICAETGWQPFHLTFWQADQIVAVLPSYIKSHSYGEFVFDWSWAEAYQRADLDYYPKLLTAVPLSPVGGARLLHAGLSEKQLETVLQAVIKLTTQQQLNSWHINFVTQQRTSFQSCGLIERYDIQFHWQNQGYRHFDEFLRRLKTKKRKNIVQERRKVHQAGWRFQWLSGQQATQNDWQLFYRMYRHTFDKKGNWAQLQPEFFSQLSEAMPDNCLLLFALKDGEAKAGAFFMRSSDCLYGRYWGAFEQSNGLHFEACYYQGIEYAIKHGLRFFEPGAQGQHKLARGFLPTKTYSYHHICNSQFHQAIADSMELEDLFHQQSLAYYRQHQPYK